MSSRSKQLLTSTSPFQWTALFGVVAILAIIGIFYIRHFHAAGQPGDVNGDGKVNIADLSIIASNFNTSGKTLAQGDLSGDGKVNILDFSILAANWGGGVATTGPPITGQNQFGIATGAQGWPSTVEWNNGSFKANIDLMATAGVHWVRMTYPWKNIEPNGPAGNNHSYDFTMANNVAGYLKSKGINLIITLDEPPVWSTNDKNYAPTSFYGCDTTTKSPQATNLPTVMPEYYAAYGGALATDLKSYSNVLAFEMGNEPNHAKTIWAFPNACIYDVFARQTYVAIHSADPTLTVLSAGIGGDTSGKGNILPDVFVSQMYAENNGNSNGLFDALAYHPYTYPNTPSQDLTGYIAPGNPNNCNNKSGSGVPGNFKGWCRMQITRDTMVANGDSAKKIWITEFGVPAYPISKAGSGSPLVAWNPAIDQTRWTAILQTYLPPDMNGNGPVLPNPTDCGTTANPTADSFPNCSPVNGFLGAGSANTQATMIAQLYHLAQSPAYNWVGPVCYFTFNDKTEPALSDNGSGLPNNGDFMGLIDFNNNPKPAYNTYHALEQAAPAN